MGHFVRECTQDANPTRAIGKLHHTLEAETPVVRSLLTEFFNKLMRVQRKHDIVQAKLKKERQQGKGGTPGAADPNPKVPLPVGKTGGANPPPKGEKKAPLRRSVRFQNQKEKGKPRPATPLTTKKIQCMRPRKWRTSLTLIVIQKSWPTSLRTQSQKVPQEKPQGRNRY